MARDFISIGSSPVDEPCAQLGSDGYYPKSRIECKALIHQLRRIFGEEPYPARLAIKSFSHDFGEYQEVVCYFDDEDEKSMNYAFKLESETPASWDDEARLEIKTLMQQAGLEE